MNTKEIKTSKSEQTRQRIIDEYIKLIGTKCWDKITVKELCSAASITRGTFYQHFTDIYDMVEQIEAPLISQLTEKYSKIPHVKKTYIPPNLFDEKFDRCPPQAVIVWFDFCILNKSVLNALIGKNGDPYFILKLKSIISDQTNILMDNDGMPKDRLRRHFVKAFIELHFLSAKGLIDPDESMALSASELINVLNAMRIGSNYLSYIETKEQTEKG